MFGSAFASLRSDPANRAYYQRKRDQDKHLGQAILALAYHRILTLHAMISNNTPLPPTPQRTNSPQPLDTPHSGSPDHLRTGGRHYAHSNLAQPPAPTTGNHKQDNGPTVLVVVRFG